MRSRPAPPLLASVFGIQMVAAAAVPGGAPTLIAAGVAAAAVLAGVFLRPAAPAAVLVTVAALALGDPSTALAAVSGLSAAAYLVIRYGSGRHVVTITGPTVIGMVGFTFAAVIAAAVPLRVPWVPLVAPALAAAVLIAVAYPLLGGDTTDEIVAAPEPVRPE